MSEVSLFYIPCRCGKPCINGRIYCLVNKCSALVEIHCNKHCLNCEGCVKCDCYSCRDLKLNIVNKKLF